MGILVEIDAEHSSPFKKQVLVNKKPALSLLFDAVDNTWFVMFLQEGLEPQEKEELVQYACNKLVDQFGAKQFILSSAAEPVSASLPGTAGSRVRSIEKKALVEKYSEMAQQYKLVVGQEILVFKGDVKSSIHAVGLLLDKAHFLDTKQQEYQEGLESLAARLLHPDVISFLLLNEAGEPLAFARVLAVTPKVVYLSDEVVSDELVPDPQARDAIMAHLFSCIARNLPAIEHFVIIAARKDPKSASQEIRDFYPNVGFTHQDQLGDEFRLGVQFAGPPKPEFVRIKATQKALAFQQVEALEQQAVVSSSPSSSSGSERSQTSALAASMASGVFSTTTTTTPTEEVQDKSEVESPAPTSPGMS